MDRIYISNDLSGRNIVSFPYDPPLVSKIKTIDGRRWHKDRKCWSFSNTNGTLEKILNAFEGEKIYINPALQTKDIPLQGEAMGEGGLEDLRRELLSRKYSHKTIKGYIYYNRDFLNFINKQPLAITDNDIKDYLLYLAEEKQSATSTLNQAINALKFYYGAMLKKKFIYEVKRPRKDRKLPVVLGQEEVGKILTSIHPILEKRRHYHL